MRELKDDIYSFVLEFMETRRILKAINMAWVALIPKFRNPQMIDEYVPISMFGALYKIISKVLESKLKSILPRLIDESQSTFVMK